MAKSNPAREVQQKYPQILTIDNKRFKLVDFENGLSMRQYSYLKNLISKLILATANQSQSDIFNISGELEIEILAALYINENEERFDINTVAERLEIFYNANAKDLSFGGELIQDFLPSFTKSIMGGFQTLSNAMAKGLK